jgi:hypothetical protein
VRAWCVSTSDLLRKRNPESALRRKGSCCLTQCCPTQSPPLYSRAVNAKRHHASKHFVDEHSLLSRLEFLQPAEAPGLACVPWL